MKITASTAALLLCASAVSAEEIYNHSPYSGMHRRHVGMMAPTEHRPVRPRHAAAPFDTTAKMIKRTKRDPLAVHGSIPVLGTGVQPIIGLTQLNKQDLVERGDDATMYDHNGNQGWNGGNMLAVSTGSGDNDEDCDEDDSQQASADSADDDDCEDEDDDDDLEDCDDENDDTSSTSSTSPSGNSDSSSGTTNAGNVVQDVKIATMTKTSTSAAVSSMFAPKSAAPSSSAASQSNNNANSNSSSNSNANSNSNSNNSAVSNKQASASASKGQVFKGGIATFYEQNGNAGACGEKHPDSDKIIALPTALWNNGKNCGRSVSIKDVKTGKTVDAVVKDLCPSCQSGTSIDLSIGAMSALLDDFKTKGIANIEWSFTS